MTALTDLPAPRAVAEALALVPGDTTTLVTLIGHADGIPLSYGHNYFPTARLLGIHNAFKMAGEQKQERLSITACLQEVGLGDFRRKGVRIRSRQPSADEARHLQMSPVESILELTATNVDHNDIPVIYAVTCFCSSRVEFVLDL